ncbi:MAG TPA: hypothetical protein VI818_02155 [Candidatus Thermoplasmatota archaeon]|nr:hypothetical protein [Candidatus Thermoplasmatota archaeon]
MTKSTEERLRRKLAWLLPALVVCLVALSGCSAGGGAEGDGDKNDANNDGNVTGRLEGEGSPGYGGLGALAALGGGVALLAYRQRH